MTAAMAVGVEEDPLRGRRRAPRLDEDWVNGQRGHEDRLREFPGDETRARGLPYLARVPDCEPPFDDEIESPSRIRPAPRPVIPLPTVSPPAARTAVHSAVVQSAAPALINETGRASSRDTGREAATARVTAPSGPGAPGVPRNDRRTAGQAGTATPRRSAQPTRVAALGVTSRTAAPSPLVHSAGVPAWSEEADIGVRLTTTADLPAAERSASVLARAVIEVLSGRRPLGQLRVHCAPDVYAGLADRPTFASAALPHLVSVRVCEPADGVAEVSVAYRRAERVRALAFRIQGVDGRWRMTALQLC
jgi:hypothetical protein